MLRLKDDITVQILEGGTVLLRKSDNGQVHFQILFTAKEWADMVDDVEEEVLAMQVAADEAAKPKAPPVEVTGEPTQVDKALGVLDEKIAEIEDGPKSAWPFGKKKDAKHEPKHEAAHPEKHKTKK